MHEWEFPLFKERVSRGRTANRLWPEPVFPAPTEQQVWFLKMQKSNF